MRLAEGLGRSALHETRSGPSSLLNNQLFQTPTCCDTCAGLEGDSAVEEASVEKTSETADDSGAAVEVETPVL